MWQAPGGGAHAGRPVGGAGARTDAGGGAAGAATEARAGPPRRHDAAPACCQGHHAPPGQASAW